MLFLATSPASQAVEQSTELALKILAGQPVDRIPVITDISAVHLLDYNLMQCFGISESELLLGNQGFNRYPSLYAQYREYFWLIGISFAFLLTLLLLFSLMLRRLRVSNQSLREREEIIQQRCNHLEELVKAHTENLNKVQRIGKIGSWQINLLDGRMIWSAETCRMFGVAEGNPVTEEDFDIRIHPDDLKRVSACWIGALAGEPYEVEHRIIVDNQLYWVVERAEIQFDGFGRAIAAVGTVQDITERKQAEEALRQSHDELKQYFEQPLIGMITAKYNKKTVCVNQRFCDLVGYTKEEMEIICWDTITHPDDLVENEKYLHQAIQGEIDSYQLEKRYIHKDGHVVYVHLAVNCVRNQQGELDYFLGMVLDITQRKQAEEAFRQSEELFRLAFENASIGMCLVDLQGSFFRVNPRLCNMFGYSKSEMESMTVNDISYPEEDVFSIEFIQKAVESRIYQGEFEKCYLHKQGRLVWGQVSSSLVKDIRGQPIYFIFHIRDMTERKRMEVALRTAERFYRATIDALHAHMCVIDEQGTILTVNRAWREFAQSNPPVPSSYAEGSNYLDVCDKSAVDGTVPEAKLIANAIRAIITGKRKHFSLEYACHSRTRERWFIVYISRFVDSGPVRVVIAHENITERKQAEIALQTSESRYRSLIAAMNEGLIMYNQQGEIITCNAAAERILGLTLEQMVARGLFNANWHTVYEDGSDFPATAHPAMVTLRTGKSQRNVIMGVYKLDNHLNWISINAEPLFNVGESIPYAVVATFTNVTESKQLNDQLKEREQILLWAQRTAQLGYWSYDLQTHQSVWSDEMKCIFWLAPQDEPLEYITCHHLVAPADWKQFDEATQAAMTAGTPYKLDLEIAGPNGERRIIVIQCIPETDIQDKVTKLNGIVQDITERRKDALELDHQRRMLRAIMDNIPAAVEVFAAPNGTVIFFNRMAENLLGRPIVPDVHMEDLNGTYRVFIAGTHIPYPVERMPLVRGLAGETSMVEDMEVYQPDGSRVLLQVIGAPIRNEAGHITASVVIFQDIGERKQVEERIKTNEQRLRRLGDNLPYGAIYQITQTPDGQVYIPYISAGIERISGVTREQVMSDINNLHSLIEPEDISQIKATRQESARALQPFDCVFRQYTLTGELRWIHCRSMPHKKEDGSIWWDGIMLDVTAQKKAEVELIRAREAAEVANRAKSAFLANMSHELRTPLNAVLGFAQILIHDTTLTEHQHNQIQGIRRGGEYLLTLINDILDLAKIEAGRLEVVPKSWDTQTFFCELESMFRIRAEQKGIAFHYEILGTLPCTLYCDDKRLRQILINLLSNAVKFTVRGGVTLRIRFTTGLLQLEVFDTGIGIPSTEINKIFEPFHQTGEDSYKVQGTGLGLTITRRLVETMDGILNVESLPGTGSLFRVVIPVEVISTLNELNLSKEGPMVTGYRRTEGSGSLSVLIVDDIIDNRQILSGLLRPLGFTIVEAEGGQHCLALLSTWSPDVILMDLRMPDLDGLETTRRLRMLPTSKNIPIIVVSASTFSDDREASLNAGCNKHIGKPVQYSELLNTLAELLPLEWCYTVDTVPETPADYEVLSIEYNDRFQHLVRCGDITRLQAFAKQMECLGHYPSFTKALRQLLNNFDLKGIKQLAIRYRH